MAAATAYRNQQRDVEHNCHASRPPLREASGRLALWRGDRTVRCNPRLASSDNHGATTMSAKKKQRKRQKARRHATQIAAAPPKRERPTPVQAIELKHTELAERLAARKDTFSQLLSKIFRDEYAGNELVTRTGLSETEHAELRSLAESAHAAFQEEMVEATSSLRTLLAEGDPLYIVSMIQAFNLMAGWGTYYEPTHRGFESKVELVAGLLLTQPPPAEPADVADETLQAIQDELDRLADLSLLRNLSAPTGNDLAAAELRFTGALHWMTLRGSSYAAHGTDLARTLYNPFDRWCLQRYGFTIDDVLDVGAAVGALWTHRLNTLLAEGRDFADRVLSHIRNPAARDGLTPERMAELESPEAQATVVGRGFIEVFQHGVTASASFTVDDLVGSGLARDRVEAVLQELSLSAGGLNPDDYRGLFDESPLVERPFFEFGGRYVLAVPGMVLRDAVALLEDRFMSGVGGFSKARAKTLDVLAVGYLTGLLPGSQGHTNLFYADAEVDGLVIFEDIAFVIEGKGTGLSVAAQRGDIVRLQRDLGRAVQEAWVQGARARDHLLGDDDAVFHDANGQEMLRIVAGAVSDVFIVNPTLHELAGHAPQLPRLRSLGLFPEGEFPWSVYINDLRVISETCENAAVFLHYLTWRARLPLGERISVTDELDLWGSYLLCERFGGLADGGHYVVGNATTDFDAYYAGTVGEGPERPKPRKFLEEPATSFVERMARDRPQAWLNAAGACLDLSIPELAFVSASARGVWREANTDRSPVVIEVGRVRLIGVPRDASWTEVMDETEQIEGDATFHLYVHGSKAKCGEIVWAKQVKPITFELSAYEKAARQRLGAAAQG
jgi:hypothetical protein